MVASVLKPSTGGNIDRGLLKRHPGQNSKNLDQLRKLSKERLVELISQAGSAFKLSQKLKIAPLSLYGLMDHLGISRDKPASKSPASDDSLVKRHPGQNSENLDRLRQLSKEQLMELISQAGSPYKLAQNRKIGLHSLHKLMDTLGIPRNKLPADDPRTKAYRLEHPQKEEKDNGTNSTAQGTQAPLATSQPFASGQTYNSTPHDQSHSDNSIIEAFNSLWGNVQRQISKVDPKQVLDAAGIGAGTGTIAANVLEGTARPASSFLNALAGPGNALVQNAINPQNKA
jgi:hypothetical protein